MRNTKKVPENGRPAADQVPKTKRREWIPQKHRESPASEVQVTMETEDYIKSM